MTPERRRNLPLRIFMWALAPLVERWRGLSLTRFIAVFICVLVGHEVFVHERALSGVDIWALVLAIATAFGKKVFVAFLNRSQWTSATLTTSTIGGTFRPHEWAHGDPDEGVV